MQVIPAIDLLDGKVVRLRKGAYHDVTVYPLSPLDQALVYRDAGFQRLHIVDLNGARDGWFVNLPVIREIVQQTGMEVQTGGGVRRYQDVQQLLDAGISRVVASSMAIKSPEDWLRSLSDFGGNRCILGMDLKDGKIAYAGWLETDDTPLQTLVAPMLAAGLQEILCTDISRDGMLSGPNTSLYSDLMRQFPTLQFIASGGISKAADLQELSLAGLHACVVGRAYYEGHILLEEMKAVF